MPFGDTAKNLLTSKTFYSGLLGIITGIATIIAGRDVDIPGSVGLTADQITTLGVTIGPMLFGLGGTMVASGVGAIYGRIVAHRPVTLFGAASRPAEGLTVMNDLECIPIGGFPLDKPGTGADAVSVGPKGPTVSPYSGHFSIVLALVLAASFAARPAAATTWYVATTGANTNDGRSEATAFRWWQKPAGLAKPGDTILVKAGTYRRTIVQQDGVLLSRSGTAAAPITLRGYGGAVILDCSSQSNGGGGVYCLHVTGSYWHLSGFAETGAKQTATDEWSLGIFIDGTATAVSSVEIANVVSYGNMGPGIRLEGAVSDTTLTNDDSHDNYDSKSRPSGGNADGIEAAVTGTGDRIVGCRAWDNSDDDFDTYDREFPNTAQPVVLSHDWAWHAGYVPGTSTPAGDGIGFKMGWNSAANTYDHNISANNRYAGFDTNQDSANQPGAYTVSKNSTYGNKQQAFAVDNNPNITVSANVALDDTSWTANSTAKFTDNSWQPPYDGAVPSDFRSTDAGQLALPRQADGSLPVITFLEPVPGGRLAAIGAYAP